MDTELVVGLASPSNIGIVAAIAVAAGLVPGVPGIVGGAPAEDAAAALPAPPAIVDVITTEPIGPEDGLIRLIVTPNGSAPAGESGSPTDAARSDEQTDEARSVPAAAEERDGGDRAGTVEHGSAHSDDEHRRATGGDAHHVIDPALLSELTDGAVLHLDRQNRPWAIFPDGTKVPIFPASGGERVRAQGAEQAEAAERSGAPRSLGQASAEPTTGGAAGAANSSPDDVVAIGTVGHALMDEIAMLAGVLSVVPLGDGSYAVTLADPAVLEGFDVEIAEDIPMGIGSEPYERYQWALDNTGDNLNGIGANPVPAQRADADIDGVEARAAATGRGVVVAVVDSGVDFSHPDLAPARRINDDENCTNGIDDDGNGFVDDCHGWDFAYEDNTPYNRGAHAHGTHVAGIIAAAIDGQGIAGVAPDAEIMDLNVGAITASGQPGITMSAVARAIRYATDNGADVINLSLGTPPGTPRSASAPVESAILHAEANGVLVVAAAGNDGVSLDAGPGWPAGFEMSNMITVGASTPSDTRAGFSNWGRVVDIFAPGELVLSTVPVAQGRWNFMSGTSQAAPIVAAAAALLLDDRPGLPPAEVRARLIAASDRHDALLPHVADGVRLNAAAAVAPGSAEHESADVAVRISGLAAIGADAPVEAEIDITVPADFGAEDDFSWHASVLVALPDGVAVLTGLAIDVDGITKESDETGSVDLGIERSGAATFVTSLPTGSYALMLEAVPADDPGQRLGAPKVVTFTVGRTGGVTDDGSTPPATTGPGSDSTGAGGSGAAGSGDAGGSSGGGTAPDGAVGGATSPGSGPSVGSPGGEGTSTQGSGGSDGSSSGPVGSGTGPGSGAGAPSSGGGSSSGASTPGAGAGGGPIGSGTSADGGSTGSSSRGGGSTGGGESATPGAGGESVGSQTPAPPAPVTSGAWSIDAVSPHHGPVGASTIVQLVGRFPSAAYVWFGDVPGTVLVTSDRMMVVLAPAQVMAGTVDISLRRTGEGVVLTMPGGFTYLGGSSNPSGTGGGGTGGGTTGSAGSGSSGSSGSAGDGGTGGDGSVGDGSVGDGNPGGGGAEGGGGGTPGAGDSGGGEEDRADDGSSPARLDARQLRSRGGEVIDLGNGLRGVMVEGTSPMVGAPRCTTDPCRI